MKQVMGVTLMILALAAITSLVVFSVQQNMPNGTTEIDLKKFASDEEFRTFVNESSEGNYNYMFGGDMMMAETMAIDSGAVLTADSNQKSSADDYSTTNIQVEGVDEADIVKNDGKYIYVATGKKVVILDAYPADEMKVLAEINFSASVSEIFINDDKLVVFGRGIVDSPQEEEREEVGDLEILDNYYYYYPRNYDPAVLTYDISDRENPVLENTVILEGNYIDSRMIGDYVYVVSYKYVYTGVESPIYYINSCTRP